MYASSSNRNLELIATLSLVVPDPYASGSSTIDLTTGPVLGSLSKVDTSRSWYDTKGLPIRPFITFDKDRYLSPGKAQQFQFWISPYVATIPPGDSLQLTLSTQAPAAACAATIGTDPCYLTAPQAKTLPGGKYTILHSATGPSLIDVPLLPYKFFTPNSPGSAIPLNWG